MRWIFYIVLIFLGSNCFAQNKTVDCASMIDSLTKIEYCPTPDQSAKILGGEAALNDQLNNVIYPSMEKPPISTKLVVGFIVDTDGSIKGKRIIRDIEGLDIRQQVLKLIDNLTWLPGECNGKK